MLTDREPNPLVRWGREILNRRVVAYNLRVLRANLRPGEVSDQEREAFRDSGVVLTGRITIEDGYEDALKLFYNTATGAIGKAPRSGVIGDYSLFRTWMQTFGEIITRQDGKHVVSDHGRTAILLEQSGTYTTAEDYRAAVSNTVQPQNRILIPERIDPNDTSGFDGPKENWGGTQIAKNAKGDLVFVRSILVFNNRYGRQSVSH